MLVGDAFFEENIHARCLGCCPLTGIIVDRKGYYRGDKMLFHDFRKGLIFVTATHIQINQYNIGAQTSSYFNGLAIIGGLSDYLYSWV